MMKMGKSWGEVGVRTSEVLGGFKEGKRGEERRGEEVGDSPRQPPKSHTPMTPYPF